MWYMTSSVLTWINYYIVLYFSFLLFKFCLYSQYVSCHMFSFFCTCLKFHLHLSLLKALTLTFSVPTLKDVVCLDAVFKYILTFEHHILSKLTFAVVNSFLAFYFDAHPYIHSYIEWKMSRPSWWQRDSWSHPSNDKEIKTFGQLSLFTFSWRFSSFLFDA